MKIPSKNADLQRQVLRRDLLRVAGSLLWCALLIWSAVGLRNKQIHRKKTKSYCKRPVNLL